MKTDISIGRLPLKSNSAKVDTNEMFGNLGLFLVEVVVPPIMPQRYAVTILLIRTLAVCLQFKAL